MEPLLSCHEKYIAGGWKKPVSCAASSRIHAVQAYYKDFLNN